ncbi:hypothetical protein Q9189_006523 [Teloschistes chrysophthalmus]
MDLQLTRVFGRDGATHTIALINAQSHDLISQYMFISSRHFLNCAGHLQTYLDELARSEAEACWVRLLRNGEGAESVRHYVANIGGFVDKFQEVEKSHRYPEQLQRNISLFLPSCQSPLTKEESMRHCVRLSGVDLYEDEDEDEDIPGIIKQRRAVLVLPGTQA